MSGMQLRLQRELFTPQNEQLLSMVHCLRVEKEKNKPTKDIFLCIVNETDRFSLHGQLNINIVEAKGTSGEKRNYDLPKRKRSWTLHELKSIDAKHKGGEEDVFPVEFDLCFGDKVFTYKAVSYEEKKRFLTALISLSDRTQMSGVRKISLNNLPADLVLDESNLKSKVDQDSTNKDSWPMMGKDVGDEAYRAISDREASDLLTLMKSCDHAVTNADLFVDDLSRQLNILDGDNIYSIMASEESINHLMNLLEIGIKNAESLESRLNQYDDLMEHIRDSMEKMDDGGGNFETVNTNNKRLYNTLESLVSHLDLSYAQLQVLSEPDFSNPQKLKEAVKAAKSLEKALDLSGVDERLLKLAAVQDQVKLCEKRRDKFSKSITRYLNNLFIHVGNDTDNLADMSAPSVQQLKLTKRKHIHRELAKYAELVHWLKIMDPASFSNLQSIYRTSVCKLYEKDLRLFFEAARYRVSGNKLPATMAGSVSGSSADLAGSKKGASRFGGTGGLLGNDTDSLGSEWSLSERERFDDVMETILIELESVCHDEQQFSIKFFKMDQISTNKDNTRNIQDAKKAKVAMEEARNMMAESFPTLDNELLHFISAYEKADSFFTLHALVRLSKHVLSAQDTGSFLAITLGLVLVKIKRNFDRFMEAQKRSIEEARAPRRNKCGILAFVSNFEKFSDTTETIFKSSERRSDLEKWYTSLVMEMVTSINRISREHTKTPAEVIKMENFHHLHSMLAQMKIQLLEVAKKDIKQRYNDALKAYVTQYFGRPLDKLNSFFDGIQTLVAAGVKESEISYQLAYSKQELRKVLAHYPGREVRKGLDNLYKKVERHLCEEENLIQVVWRAMQEEFIQQYKCIEDLTQRCYPGAQISLDFTINDVLEYFSDIARSH